ncbi:MAG: RNA-binding S4 domain-containing protein [Aedoeadaptatus pacaensis]|uniref:RNA-binding S4 domain-containing protein n=1 Tax=Aedoeadaptatus TaxID=2981628 RepID=UPI00083942CB|nr:MULTISPECIES: RNA-binding S4 domain-containing protein [Peptoniphilus]
MKISTDFIKLDSFLKYVQWVDSGGMAKAVVSDGLVYVNGEMELRRGRKLYPGDVVEFMGEKDSIERE